MKLKKKIVLGSVPALLLLLLLVMVGVYGITSLTESNQWVDHTHKVIQEAMKIEASAVNMETGMRGYLLAGKEEFLEPYWNGATEFDALVAELKKTVNDNKAQVKLLEEIKATIHEWKEKAASPNIELRKRIGDAANMNDMAKSVQEARGKVLFDELRTQINTFIVREEELIEKRIQHLEAVQFRTANNLKNMEDSGYRVNHTYQVMIKAEQIVGRAANMESGLRGFLLSGEDVFLEPYHAGNELVFENIKELKEMILNNPSRIKALADAEAVMNEWRAKIANPAIQLRKDVSIGVRPFSDISDFVSEKQGKHLIDAFCASINSFIDVEKELIVERKKDSETASDQMRTHFKEMVEAIKWVDHTHHVIRTALSIMGAAVDMETGVRGYLLAGKESFLHPLKEGENRFFSLVSELKATVSDNPEQVELLAVMENTLTKWKENVASELINLRREIGHSETMDNMADVVGQAKGKQFFDKFRGQLKTFKEREESLMAERQKKAEGIASTSQFLIYLFGASAILIALIISYFSASRIVKPVNQVVEGLIDMAEGEGDLRKTIHVVSKDEIGDMAGWFNTFVAKLRAIIVEIADASGPIQKSSHNLSAVSTQMASAAEEMNAQANVAASASEQVSAGVSTVAAASEQAGASTDNIASMTEEMSSTFRNVADFSKKASQNVSEMAQGAGDMADQINTVASALEEMTSSLNEVARNTSKASRISQKAGDRTEDVNAKISVLVSASKQIGKVVSLIKDIADQTNMLALNATIEAAGAGESGKGFAVVAGEVKELAKQSADATDEIAGQIEKIQTATDEAVLSVEEISKVIADIIDINTMIASSVEEQNATAAEISKSVAQASANIQNVANKADDSSRLVDDIANSTQEASTSASEIARNVDELRNGVNEVAKSSNEAARGVNEISKNIRGIVSAAKDTSEGASKTNLSSIELSEMAKKLNEIVRRFKI